MTKNKKVTCISLLGILLLATTIISLGTGAVYVAPLQVLTILADSVNLPVDGSFTNQQQAIVTSIRLPRILLALLVGMALAISGASLQGLFKNPLADPGLIGVSSGAMVAVVVFIVLGTGFFSEATAEYLLPIWGFVGGLVSTIIVYRMATTGNLTQITTMLLAGIAIGAFSSAVVGVFIFLADDNQIRSITFWLLGSVSAANWPNLFAVSPFILSAIVFLPFLGRNLNALSMGDSVAFHLGVKVQTTKRLIILLSCMATGAAVCVSGTIGFIGLVVPHLIRLLMGADHRLSILATALLGGSVLVLADLLARTLVAPAEMPLGVVTSLIGAPFFIWLVYQHRERFATNA